MKAVILAGGEGKRLRPITCTVPKPLVPLLNKPTIFYTLELLKKHGIEDVVITLGYMGDDIKKEVGNGQSFGLRVAYSDPAARFGTAGSVRTAVGIPEDTVVVLSGDGITDADITKAVKAHKEKGVKATVCLYRVAEPTEYGIALTDGEGMITRFIEKPSEGEVFSDRANTGIYIFEPEVIGMIPEGKEFDFSKDLFPMLIEKGIKLFGFNMEGYWCDIGDPSALRRAQAEMLEGRCVFSTKADVKDGGVHIEPSAQVSPEAMITGPCYIGADAEIGSMAEIAPYSVICSGAVIMEGSSVKRSTVMKGAVIRSFAELRGSIICENAEVDSRCRLMEGSVVGAEARLGKNVTVGQGILIWPDKYVDPGTKCTRDVVWGVNRPFDSDDCIVSGYADKELTPDLALRIAAAFASGKKNPTELGVGSDGGAASVMIKQAVISGILSQGADVISSGCIGRSAFGYMIRNSGLSGGVYVSSDAFERKGSLVFYGDNGVEAESSTIRELKKRLDSGDVRPTTSSEIGLIRSTGNIGLEYEAYVARLVNTESIRSFNGKLILNSPPEIADAAARIMLRLGWTADTVSEMRKLIPTVNSDAISVLVDKNERVSFMTSAAGEVDPARTVAVLAAASNSYKLPVPGDFDAGMSEYLGKKGKLAVYAPDSAVKRRAFAMKEGIYEPTLLEPEAMIVKLCELFAEGKLEKICGEIPKCERTEAEIPVSKCDFGRMLRSVIENEFERTAEMTDGVRLRYDSGWVTVRPSAARSSLRIVAGSRDGEYARELCDLYAKKLRKLKRDSDNT